MTSDQSDSILEIRHDAFLPIALLSFSAAILLVYQLIVGFEQKTQLDSQKATMTQNIEGNVQQAAQVKKGLEALVVDLLDLAKNDRDAQNIVQKYQIKQNAPAPGASPAASPSAP